LQFTFFLSYRRSLQPSKESIQHFTKFNFLAFFYVCGSFFPLGSRSRIRIAVPDTDPASRDPIESGSTPGLDPQHCLLEFSFKKRLVVFFRFVAEELKSWNLLTRTGQHFEFINWKLTFFWLIGCFVRHEKLTISLIWNMQRLLVLLFRNDLFWKSRTNSKTW
jgi:hypothetical protein